MQPASLIFDLDGTIVDSTDSVIGQLQVIGREFGNRELTQGQIIAAVHSSGGAMHTILRHLIGETTEELLAQIRVRHSAILKEFNHLLKPYMGAVETLATLQERGHPLAIFTSRSQWMIDDDPACELLLPYFSAVIALEHTPRPKPHPDGIIVALEALGVDKNNAFMVGDTVSDIQSAHAAGIKAIGITHGYGARDDLLTAQADFIIDDLPTLLTLFR